MNQSNAIFAALTIAFLVFITIRGELRTYMGFLLGATAGPANTPVVKTAGIPNPTGSVAVQKATGYAEAAAKFAVLF